MKKNFKFFYFSSTILFCLLIFLGLYLSFNYIGLVEKFLGEEKLVSGNSLIYVKLSSIMYIIMGAIFLIFGASGLIINYRLIITKILSKLS